MPLEPASHHDLFPRPRSVKMQDGVFQLGEKTSVTATGGNDGDRKQAVRILRDRVDRAMADLPPSLRRRRNEPPVIAIELNNRPAGAQAFAIAIRPQRIVLKAYDAAGLRYGILAIGQLLDVGSGAIRAMDIKDSPDFSARGVMLDISRDKVPTMATLRRLVDRFAGWRINQLQLYTEHTFAYAGHERVWQGWSPMTAEQVEQLDRHCRDRGIELVPNQNSFGHMERWLQLAPYTGLAEATGPWKTAWGTTRTRPTTLNPSHPGSIQLIDDLYGQLLPHFSSRMFNVGCDETFELGQGRSKALCERRGVGRVYVEFLRRLHRLAKRHGRRMQFWSDVVHAHPEMISHLPKDAIALVWGYEAGFPFDRKCAELAAADRTFYVCPGTSSWCSYAGRTSNAMANLREAAEIGAKHGAVGYLITDWGDWGHPQYLPVSYAGLMYGAAVSWCRKSNADIDVAEVLSRRVFDDPTGKAGQAWFDLGKVHEESGVSFFNRSIFFAVMQTGITSLKDKRNDKATVGALKPRRIAAMRKRLDVIEKQAAAATMNCSDADLVRQELCATLAIMRHALNRAEAMQTLARGSDTPEQWRKLAREIGRIIDAHTRLWRARNRTGGLAHSLRYYQWNLREYEWAAGDRSKPPPPAEQR